MGVRNDRCCAWRSAKSSFPQVHAHAHARTVLSVLFVTALCLAGMPAETQHSGQEGVNGARNAGAGNHQEQLLQRVNAAGTIRESRAMLQQLVQTAEDSATSQRTHELIAELAELSGEYSIAQQHYRLAWEAREDSKRLDLLLASASLRLELGELTAALAETEAVVAGSSGDDRLQTDARLLRVRTLVAMGDSGKAAAELGAVERRVIDAGNASQVFLLYELSRSLGDPQTASAAGSTLRDRYPDSVEYALIRQDLGPAGRRVERYPSPSQLFVAYSPDGAIPIPEPSLSPASAQASISAPPRRDVVASDLRTVRAIQTGAFRDPENATYMARDISNAGFAAEVRERTGDDAPVYVVLVPMDSGTTRDQALERMTALKEAGIEGFLVYD